MVDQQVISTAQLLLEKLATPVSLSVSLQIRYGCWVDIANRRVDPLAYNDPESFARDYQACELLRKYVDLPNLSKKDRASVAREGFYDAERQCSITNHRLSPLLEDHLFYGAAVWDIVSRIRKEIKAVLGKIPSVLHGRFGPGATYGDRGRLTTIPDKMSSRPTLTSPVRDLLIHWGETHWGRAVYARRDVIETVRGNRFTTVPKDSLKDRGICIEPSVNLFYQLAVGKEIRDLLRAAGIDLRRGQEIHRQVACDASASGLFSTIDLSSASDTVSRLLVKLLLPKEWFDLLDCLRSPTTLIDGKTVLLEKFSSMGNGYTFELETLIFYGICRACDQLSMAGEGIWVYGDDIICRSSVSDNVLSTLKFLGFTPNGRKTFTSGPFRESCGGDFFDGVAVRPFNIKETPCEPQHFITLANQIRRFAAPNWGRWHDLRNVWFSVLDALPTQVRRCRGPESLGDIVVHDDQHRWDLRVRSGVRFIRCYRPAAFGRIGIGHFRADVQLATALYGAIDTNQKGHPLGVSFRDNVRGYKVGWVPWS